MMDGPRREPLDLDYIERHWVTKGLDCPCRSKTAIRALIAEMRNLQQLPYIEMSQPLTDDVMVDFVRKYHEATARIHPHYRVAVLPPPMTVRARRWWPLGYARHQLLAAWYWLAATVGYWERPYDMLADRRRWRWQPATRCPRLWRR